MSEEGRGNDSLHRFFKPPPPTQKLRKEKPEAETKNFQEKHALRAGAAKPKKRSRGASASMGPSRGGSTCTP
eukprot:519424-Pelagomonas_calceolata.AAC.2